MSTVAAQDELATVVRPAEPADAEQLTTVLHTLDHPAGTEEVAARLERLGADPSYRTLVAERDGRVLGLAGVRLAYSYESDNTVLELVTLATSAEAQGQGVGRTLLSAVDALGRAEGASRIVATASHVRTAAHRMYRACGFDDTGLRFVKRLGPS